MTARSVAAGALTAYGLARMASFARHTAPRVAAPWAADDVVAVVPARDEAAGVAACVTALRANGVREVVVVDDASSDGTAALAAAAGARVVAAPPLAPGQVGKAAACRAGAAAAGAGARWLWFVDADVVVAPDALSRLLAEADETGAALVSALGRVTTPTAGTAWLMPEVGLTLARRLRPDELTSGQCLLVRRAAYDAVGGHDASAVVEDVALGRAVAARGGVVRTVLGPDLYETAMYASLPGAWRGLLRSSATVRTRPLVEAAWLAAALLGGRRAYALHVVVSAGGRLVARAPLWPAVAAPAAEAALVANWWLSRRRGPVPWRGRPV